jgi:predicted dinucleotide-binding enzyme
MTEVVVIGAGSIGQAIARRVSSGKHVVLGDQNDENAQAAAEVMRDAGFDVNAEGAFITGGDFIMDGGVTASYFFGELAPK